MYKEKLVGLVDTLKVKPFDPELLISIRELIQACSLYFEKVCASEAYILLRPLTDAEEYRLQYAQMDKSRSVAHNNLISRVKLLNKYCTLAGCEPIFPGDTDNRIRNCRICNAADR